jgi:hypothetical protein
MLKSVFVEFNVVCLGHGAKARHQQVHGDGICVPPGQAHAHTVLMSIARVSSRLS